MSRSIKSTLALCLLSLTLFLSAQQIVDGIAAIVGEDIILFSEVNQYAFEMAQQSGVDISGDSRQFARFQESALRDMVNAKILLLQAAADSIEINERNVESTVNAQLEQYIGLAGSPEMLEMYFDSPLKKIREMLYERIKSAMISQQLQQEKFSKIKISRPEVVAFFEEYRDSIPELPERVDIDHILLKEKPSPASKERSYEKLMDIRGKILAGNIRFEDAALEYSQDPGSAADGGDLGFVSKGTFVPEFEKAAFALTPNEISLPVETQFGYHLIQLIEKRGELIHTRHILIPIESSDEDRKYVINMLSTIRDSILQGVDFAYLARKYSEDPDVEANAGRLGEFSLEALQIPEFAEVAVTLQEGGVSEPFQSGYGFHILRLNKHLPSEIIRLEKHYPILENMALNEKRSSFWNAWMEKLYGKYYVEIKL
ncbi:MAG: peptidylprolyl isomerase [Candidatus Neomarinimicrobiota bacterium]|jgi:peptidyl-prolyl cis-trans isomerase SurA|nr:peptidylprolyl isomerase [Candidatus Neomarinimicrobiota bacterium]MDD3966418.1 peptidylprolyl isomerase [Candidatus Neomarinimicrobiota bacterium]MDX9780029.1 peptidylprolyl isomerase [bacterium]